MKIGEEKAGEKRCRIVVVASRNCIIRAPSERDFELLMNEYNASLPFLDIFPPNGNGILMQILSGEPIIPL